MDRRPGVAGRVERLALPVRYASRWARAVREPPLQSKRGLGTPALSLTNYCAVVADYFDRVRICVEDAHLHGRCGEQDPEDAALEVARLRGLDPTNLRVIQVRIGGNESLQKEAQRESQCEREDDAAEDQEVQITPAEIQKTQSEGYQDEDRGEQVRGHDGRAAIAVDGEPLLPVLQPADGLPGGALDLGYGANTLHEEPVVGREPVQLAARLPLHHHHDGRMLEGMVAA